MPPGPSTKPLRLLLCVGTAGIGGTELQLLRLAQELSESGLDVHLAFLTHGGPLVERARSAPIRVHQFRIAKRVAAPLELFRFASMLRQFRFDVVHAFLPHAIVISRLALDLSRSRAVFLSGIRNEPSKYARESYVPLANALRRSEAVTVNSEALVSEVGRYARIQSSSVRMIPNGVSMPPSKSDPGKEPPRAVVVANFHPHKGHDVLLQAVQRTFPPFHTTLIGGGTGRGEFEARAHALGLNGRFTVLEVDTPPDLGAFQFAIHPSRIEGLPNAVLEEMSYGLPIVGSRVGGIPDLIGAQGGLLCDPGDVAGLSVAMSRMATDRTLRVACGTRNRVAAREFSWPSITQKYLDLYTEILWTREHFRHS